jgi:putative transposase
MRYRRAHVGGGTYFFTVNLAERSRTLLVDHADVLRSVMREVKVRHPFHIDAIVILPEHLHAIWTLPRGDRDTPMRWALIKAGFSRRISHGERITVSRASKGERRIRQRRYWEHLIRDERDYERHVDYIHFNPVKHGHVNRAVDWPYSSIHRYIASGVVDRNWGGDGREDGEKRFGER